MTFGDFLWIWVIGLPIAPIVFSHWTKWMHPNFYRVDRIFDFSNLDAYPLQVYIIALWPIVLAGYVLTELLNVAGKIMRLYCKLFPKSGG